MNDQGTHVLSTQSKAEFYLAVDQAVAQLRLEELVGVPTETVCGSAGNTFSIAAVKKIFEVKGRPSSNPLIVHVADWAMVEQCSSDWMTRRCNWRKRFGRGP
jgi:L-threonylcarbamoyladenylate synthase